MTLFFIGYVFFVFHILFFLKYFLLGISYQEYFGFKIEYLFSGDVAAESFFFAVFCALSFFIGYYFVNNMKVISFGDERPINSQYIDRARLIVVALSSAVSAYAVIVYFVAGGNYNEITLIRETYGFLFEIRLVFLTALSYILLNVPLVQVLRGGEYKYMRGALFIYALALVLFQARSPLFELFIIVIYSYLMQNRDVIRPGHVVALLILSLCSNLFVLARTGFPEDIAELAKSMLSFEYEILINNILSAAVYDGVASGEYSFMESLKLVIPSPIRSLLGIEVVKSYYYENVSLNALSTGGGFSLFGEMYSNFGWYSSIAFFLFGGFLGHLARGASRVGKVDLFYASAPLIYGAFILALRNDLGPFLKVVVQIYLIAIMLGFVVRLRPIWR